MFDSPSEEKSWPQRGRWLFKHCCYMYESEAEGQYAHYWVKSVSVRGSAGGGIMLLAAPIYSGENVFF